MPLRVTKRAEGITVEKMGRKECDYQLKPPRKRGAAAREKRVWGRRGRRTTRLRHGGECRRKEEVSSEETVFRQPSKQVQGEFERPRKLITR